MATYAKSGTLTANVVTTVTVRGWAFGVNVINRSAVSSAGSQIWVRIDGTDPTVAGDECFVVMGARNFPVREQTVTVKLIASANLDYTVEGMVPTA